MINQKKVLLITSAGFDKTWKLDINKTFGKKKIEFCVDTKKKLFNELNIVPQ